MGRAYINDIDSLIVSKYKVKNQSQLEEPNVMNPIPIDKSGICYRLYSFDEKYKKGECPDRLITIFEKIEGAQIMCDYCVFGYNDRKLYVLLIELKKGDDSVLPQLKAGEQLAIFIINTINRMHKKNLKPQIRFISVRGYNILTKPTTRMKSVVYDKDNLYTFCGKNLCLKACMV